ncbi:MAG: TonB family protein [Chromatiales bacterium]|nr:TonB family protein [Chromatiales bacterium]
MLPVTRLVATLFLLLGITGAGGEVPVDAPVAAERAAAEERYQRLIAEDRNAEAAAAAVEVVNLTAQLHGTDSIELAGPLTNLATAQLRNGDLREAEANYQLAIALLEKREGFLSARLVDPLTGLGEAYVRSEQYALATQAYERALRVNHVNEGFYNLEQIRIRDGLTEGYLGQQDLEKANFHQEAQIYVQQRKLGRDNPELVGPLTKLGRWYDRSGQTEAARLVYQGAARIVQKTGGEDSPDMVEPLLAIAETYRQQALLPPDPESNQSPETLLPLSGMMLRKALGIVEKQSPPDPESRARILVKLGDLYLMWGKQNTAADRYREAWQALSADPALEARRDEFFAKPVRIMGPLPPAIFPVPPRKAPPPAPKDLEPGYVVVRFNVDQLGRVSDATVVESDPANLLEERVRATAKNTLFRPRYVDGAAVATSGLVFRHEFRYAPKKLEKEDKPPPEQGDKPLAQPTSGAGT